MRRTLPLLAFGALSLGLPAFPQPLQFSGDFAPDKQEPAVLRFQPKRERFIAALQADMKRGTVTFTVRGPDGKDLGSRTAGVFTLNNWVIQAPIAGTYLLEVKPRGAVGHWEARITEPADSRLQLLSGGLMILIALAGGGIWALVSGTPFRWFAAGAAIWTVGVLLKFAAHYPLNSWYVALASRHKTFLELMAGSIYTGLMTGVFEIGITLSAALLWRSLAADSKRAVAVGLGAGSIEALLLGALSLASSGVNAPSAPLFWLVGPVERVITIACHISSRTLVLRAVAGGGRWGFWAGFALLSGLDALAGAVLLSGFLKSHSVWWSELAFLPLAVVSWPLARWAVTHWPEGASARVQAEFAASGQ